MSTHQPALKNSFTNWINEITTAFCFGVGFLAGIFFTLSGNLAGGATIFSYLIGTLTTIGYYGYECYYGNLIHEFDSTIFLALLLVLWGNIDMANLGINVGALVVYAFRSCTISQRNSFTVNYIEFKESSDEEILINQEFGINQGSFAGEAILDEEILVNQEGLYKLYPTSDPNRPVKPILDPNNIIENPKGVIPRREQVNFFSKFSLDLNIELRHYPDEELNEIMNYVQEGVKNHVDKLVQKDVYYGLTGIGNNRHFVRKIYLEEYIKADLEKLRTDLARRLYFPKDFLDSLSNPDVFMLDKYITYVAKLGDIVDFKSFVSIEEMWTLKGFIKELKWFEYINKLFE